MADKAISENPMNESNPNIHLNLNVRGLTGSATLVVNELCDSWQKQGKKVYKMGLGQSPFPVPELVVRGLKANAHQKAYLPVKGLYQLREAVAEYYNRRFGIESKAENVLIGPGSKELMFLIQLVYYGDLVIPTPSWVSYAPQAQIIGRHVRWLPTFFDNNWRLMPDELEALCKADPDRPRLLILNYPNNPIGHTYGPEDLEEISNLARKYRMVLLSDEIYGEIHHKGNHRSIAGFYPEGTIISTGLSKWCGAGGWRLGCFIFPDSLRWLLEAISVAASETYTSTSAPIQYAAVEAFKGGDDIENYLRHCRRILASLGKHCATEMMKSDIEVIEPEGAFYLFPRFARFRQDLKSRGIKTSPQLCEALFKDTGVAVLPGSNFGRPAANLTFRMAYVDFDGGAALKASEALPLEKQLDESFLKQYCGNVVTAMDSMCQWIDDVRGK